LRLYRYVGPKQIAERTGSVVRGVPISSPDDVIRWIQSSGQMPDATGSVTATFVVDESGRLLMADRHSEHVACAGGRTVWSAGEIRVAITGGQISVIRVSNQSTGYCPELDSWPEVVAALRAAGLEPPAGFDPACEFRRCVSCGERSLVKDGAFECLLCGAELPAEYNCQPE
jgi:hypothetical protein